MSTVTKENVQRLPTTPWGFLPPNMRVLFVTGPQRMGSWLAEAFAADSACHVLLEESEGIACGLAKLRDEVFDAVLVSHEASLDALEVLDAIRAGSSDEQPILVLGQQPEKQMTALCFEAGADAYVCVEATTTRTLLWTVARAMERHELLAENRRLQQAQRHRLQLEHDEATRLLQQQRVMISDLEEILEGAEQPTRRCPNLPDTLIQHYRELLRAYVIMGTGNMGQEMGALAELLASAHVSSHQAMLLHLFVLEEMVEGLGSRSARHVMNRADMLILEMMINLAEGFRTRLLDHIHPARQLTLPGFFD